jgi:hypothetical protein
MLWWVWGDPELHVFFAFISVSLLFVICGLIWFHCIVCLVSFFVFQVPNEYLCLFSLLFLFSGTTFVLLHVAVGVLDS